MSNDSQKNGFLSYFSIDDLKAVKEDLDLSLKGFKFVYVVDTYDILRYTLPFISNKKGINESYQYNQTTISYEVVFTQNDRFQFILADEYRKELTHIIDNFNDNIYNFQRNKGDVLKRLTKSLSEKREDKVEAVLDDLELFTILYIFYNKGDNLLNRFKEFIKNTLNIDSFNSGNEVVDNQITNVFKNVRPSSLTLSIFDDFVDINKYKLLSYDNDYERYCYLDNTYRDISVIDRIYNANKTLLENNINVKYLSSTPRKTKQLFKILKQHDNEMGGFNRNINQLYLFNHILDKSKNDQELAFEYIDDLIDFKKKQIDLDNRGYSIGDSISRMIESLNTAFLLYKREYEKSFYFDSFIHYKDMLTKAIFEYNQNNSPLKLFAILDDLRNLNSDDYRQLAIVNNISSISNINQTFYLAKKLDSISKKDKIICINTGKDIIKNMFHHLPYLLFMNFTKESVIIESFINLLNSLSSHSHLVGSQSDEFRSDFEKVLSLLSSNNYSLVSHTVDFIILIFLNLITGNEEYPQDEKEIIRVILHQQKILKESFIESSYNKSDSEMTIIQRNPEILIEIDYLLIWLFRRTLQFENAIKIYKNNKNDVRFIHGLALTYHSLAYYNLDEEKFDNAIKFFKLSRNELFKAYKFYMKLTDKSSITSDLIRKQQIGILNTVIDSNNRIFEITKITNDDKLIESRICLSSIKIAINDFEDIEYESLETINHSESELEYYEALSLFNKGDYYKSILKLGDATERTRYYSESKHLVGDRFKVILNKINELRFRNFKKLKII